MVILLLLQILKKLNLQEKNLHNKKYYRHTGYPGGIKSTSPPSMLNEAKNLKKY